MQTKEALLQKLKINMLEKESECENLKQMVKTLKAGQSRVQAADAPSASTGAFGKDGILNLGPENEIKYLRHEVENLKK